MFYVAAIPDLARKSLKTNPLGTAGGGGGGGQEKNGSRCLQGGRNSPSLDLSREPNIPAPVRRGLEFFGGSFWKRGYVEGEFPEKGNCQASDRRHMTWIIII